MSVYTSNFVPTRQFKKRAQIHWVSTNSMKIRRWVTERDPISAQCMLCGKLSSLLIKHQIMHGGDRYRTPDFFSPATHGAAWLCCFFCHSVLKIKIIQGFRGFVVCLFVFLNRRQSMPMAAQECRGVASTNASSDQTPVLLWHYQALKNPTCRNNWKVIWKNTLTGKVLQKLNVPPFFSSLILG